MQSFGFTLSNFVLSATSRSEADMFPMSNSEDDWDLRFPELWTDSLFRLEVDPVNFPELPWRPVKQRHYEGEKWRQNKILKNRFVTEHMRSRVASSPILKSNNFCLSYKCFCCKCILSSL